MSPIKMLTISLAATLVVVPVLLPAQTIEQSASYVSQIDQDLTLRRVSVLPVTDNLEGIYSRPIEAQLISLVKDSHRWDYVESTVAGNAPAAIELEENSSLVQKTVSSIDADAVFVAAASRGPTGLSIRLDLFLKKDGRLLAQETLKDHPRSEIPELREQVKNLYRRAVAKLPYDGLILSRRGNQVTINLGKSDGVVKDQTVTAVQIISVNRHPKFSFILSSEKEILGTIKILKVDETLSFGAIVSEKERGAISRLAKISGLNQVTYDEPSSLTPGVGSNSDLSARADSNVAFGEKPREWLPVRPPAFGQVGIALGVGTLTSNVNLNVGSFEASSSFYPTLAVHGELWLNPKWIVRAETAQGVASTSNPRSGSSPGTLNHAMSRYALMFGYNILLRDDFFGPKIQLIGGISTYRMFVDDSTPQALTTTTFSGALIGIAGMFPLADDKQWSLGGKLNLFLMPSLSETPKSSGGSPKASINEFSLLVEKKLAENLRGVGSIDFSLYSASFTGRGTRVGGDGVTPENATSLSQSHRSITAGVVYQF